MNPRNDFRFLAAPAHIEGIGRNRFAVTAALDLFGNPITPALRVRLERPLKTCCGNVVAIVAPGRGPHAAELRCAGCDAHRGWLRRKTLDFLTDLSQRFGAPAEPMILRDQQIGDHTMSDKKYDNYVILFRNEDKAKDTYRDYQGSITVAGTEYWLSAWIKDGKRGKFMTLSVKPKQQAATSAKSSLTDDMIDAIPF